MINLFSKRALFICLVTKLSFGIYLVNKKNSKKSLHYKSIVVAVDGSKEAEYAFRKSIDVAKRNVGSILNIANVIDTRSFEAYDRSIFDSAQKQSEELLNGYKVQAKACGC